jgi:peroxiredoxin
MSVSSPICNFGEKSYDFSLQSTDGKLINLSDVKGQSGFLLMFICNHCPYVQAIINFLVNDVKYLEKIGIKSAAIMSNDTKNYPEDSFENMKKFAKENNFSFPYLFDEDQKVAKKYSAVCTPDFFGYNNNSELQYRGRILDAKKLKPIHSGDTELRKAMKLIAETRKGPQKQIPSMGCSIKWFK